MTRFARANGSKSSNERVPESATSWNVMKAGLHNAQNASKNNEEMKKMNAIRQKSYDNYVRETEEKKEKTWVEFPTTKKPQTAKMQKKEDVLITEDDVTDEMITGFLQSDSEIDAGLKDQIEEVLKTESKPKKINKKKAKPTVVANKTSNVKLDDNDDKNDDDDAPEEISAKIPPQPITPKKKNKQKKQNIADKSTNKVQNEQKKQNIADKSTNKVQNKQKKQNIADKSTNKEQNTNKDQQKTGKKQQGKKQKNNVNDEQSALAQNGQKRKLPKPRDNEEHKRRKPDLEENLTISINGQKEKLIRFEGYPVLQSDHERLVTLKKTLISKGIPRSEVTSTIKLQRRKAEKALARIKKQVCFHCRKAGHVLSQCTELNKDSNIETAGTGICFRCGSTEHTHTGCRLNKTEGFKFASCFICRQQGHIARECPDNPRGMYPEGGCCNLCGDVTHLKKDCPKAMQKKQDNSLFLETISDGNIESLAGEEKILNKSTNPLNKKVVKF